MNNKPTATQQMGLEDAIRTNPNLQSHFDFSNLYEVIDKITIGQYRFIYALLFNKKYSQLNKILIQLGLKQKI